MSKALQVRVLFRGKPLRSRKFEKERLVIGRDPDCDLILFNVGVSRHHALIERTDDGYLLRDLGSSNGTRVEGRSIDAWPIEDGGKASITQFELVFHFVDDVPDACPTRAPAGLSFGDDRTMSLLDG